MNKTPLFFIIRNKIDQLYDSKLLRMKKYLPFLRNNNVRKFIRFSTTFIKACMLILIVPSVLLAQKSNIITGEVKDINGDPMKGVTVVVLNSTKPAITDAQGKFKIEIPSSESVLMFTSVGYEPLRITPGSQKILKITMKETVSSLNDVVVIGYGTSRRKDLLTSVSKAPVQDMKKAPVPSFDQMLSGRIAGVTAVSSDGQPGGTATISIRGASVTQDVSPLFVVDGIPIENLDINSINPNDIESMDVLKDPASVAIYGSKGGNGVILITTRQGVAGKPKVTYSFSQGIQQVTKQIPMMDPYNFVKLELELDSVNSTPAVPSTSLKNQYIDATHNLDYYKSVSGYNWEDLLCRTGTLQNHYISLSGGNNDTRYIFSGGYFNQNGIIINTGLKRYEGRFSFTQRINKNIMSGITGSYSNTISYGTVPVSGATGGVVQGMWQYRPTNGLAASQNLATNLIDSVNMANFLNGTTSSLGDNLVNPVVQAQNEYRHQISNTSYVNAYLEYSIMQYLKLRVTGGYSSTDLQLNQFYNDHTQQGLLLVNANGAQANTNGINGAEQRSLAQTKTTSTTLSYSKKIREQHKLDIVGGFEYTYAEQNQSKFASINIPQGSEYLGIISMQSGTPSSVTLSATHNQQMSFFGRMMYNYASKYYFMGTIRDDGSSRFAAGHQWGIFPSGAAGWAFSEEKFMKKLNPVLNYGKLRVSYGTTGNDRVGDFSYLSQYGGLTNSQGYAWNNIAIGGITPYFYGNNALTWETSTGLDLGLDLEFFNGRISIQPTYYNKITKNFLLNVTLPYSAGYPNGANGQYQNVGQLSNKGFELSINTTNIKKKNFSWLSSFNIAFNQSKIDKFYNGLEVIQNSWSLTGTATAWVTKVGGPISQFYGYKWGGVYQYADFSQLPNGAYVLKPGVASYATNVQPGDPKYKDLNGDGVVDANDQTTLGSPLPNYTGGFNNNLNYKNWSLNIFFQFSEGNKILNANKVVFESTGGYDIGINQFAAYENRWTPTNPTNDIPRARYNLKGDAGSTNPRPSSWDIEDGSYIRLKTISLAYNLPRSFLTRTKINNIALNISAQNIFTWTKYSGMDPEVGTFRASNPANSPFGGSNVGSTTAGGAGYSFIQPSSGTPALAQGYDYTPYPRALTLTFGLNVTF